MVAGANCSINLITERSKSWWPSFGQRAIGLMRTLAEETGHDFLTVFSCPCPGKCLAREKRRVPGKTGHGEAWCNAARAIESRLQEEWNDKLILVIIQSLSLDPLHIHSTMLPDIPTAVPRHSIPAHYPPTFTPLCYHTSPQPYPSLYPISAPTSPTPHSLHYVTTHLHASTPPV